MTTKPRKKYRPGRYDPEAAARKLAHIANQQTELARMDPVEPVTAEDRTRLMATLRSALDSIAKGSAPTIDDWQTLADAVNCTEAMIRRGNIDPAEGMPIALAAMRAMTDASRRYKAGQGMRLDGPGLKALQDLLDVYEQTLETFSERETLEIMFASQRLAAQHFAEFKAAQ